MNQRPIIGYIVSSPHGVLVLDLRNQMLWVSLPSSGCTLFETRREAQSAMTRSRRLATQRGYKWSDELMWIHAVREAVQGEAKR